MDAAASANARGRSPRRRPILTTVAAFALLASGCAASVGTPRAASPISGPATSPDSPGAPADGATAAAAGGLTIYTSVTQSTVDAVVAAYGQANPSVSVKVFRAPTAQLAGRIAAELQDGPVKADILWLTDPLSIQAYARQGLLMAWSPAGAAAIAPAYREPTYWGTRFVNMVIVTGAGVGPGPAAWTDLADPAYRHGVALPDPGFAGSAFGALAYLAQQAGYGFDFYRSLRANGAIQVQAPDDVTTGVAEGRFKAGMTLDNSARTAIAKGSPIRLVWPSDGAIAVYSPIGVLATSANAEAARSFVEFVLSDPGQRAIAGTGWQPMLAEAGGPQPGGRQVYPDWARAYGHQADLLAQYRAIFGG